MGKVDKMDKTNKMDGDMNKMGSVMNKMDKVNKMDSDMNKMGEMDKVNKMDKAGLHNLWQPGSRAAKKMERE